jgi:hypothetical protein
MSAAARRKALMRQMRSALEAGDDATLKQLVREMCGIQEFDEG